MLPCDGLGKGTQLTQQMRNAKCSPAARLSLTFIHFNFFLSTIPLYFTISLYSHYPIFHYSTIQLFIIHFESALKVKKNHELSTEKNKTY